MGRVGQQFIRFDAPSKRATEKGFHAVVHGSELVDFLYRTLDGSTPDRRLLSIGEWMMPMPHQFRTDWGRDPDSILADYVLDKTKWMFSPEINVAEWVPSTKAGTAGPTANKWLGFVVPPSGATSVGFSDFADLEAKIGATLPAGMVTVATAFETPSGQPLSEAGYLPAFYWNRFPAPDECVIFGFGPYVLVLYDAVTYFLHTHIGTDGTPTTDLVGVRKIGSQTGGAGPFGTIFGGDGQPIYLERMNVQPHGVIVLPVGPDELHVFFLGTSQPPLVLPIRNSVKAADSGSSIEVQRYPDAGNAMLVTDAGGVDWWIAAKPGQVMQCQVQIIGYDYALPPFTNVKLMFDLGQFYKPLTTPIVGAQVCFFGREVDIFPGSAAVTLTTNGDGDKVYDYGGAAQAVTVGLRDELGTPWASDGTHSSGYIHVDILAGNPGGIGGDRKYLSPQVRVVEYRFPPVLAARAVNTQTIDDTNFTGWKCSTSLQDPNGKRLTVEMTDAGATLLESAGLTKRGNYRVDILEDTDGNGTPDTIRASGWMRQPGQVLRRVKPDQSTLMARRFDARGHLSRAEQKFTYLPQLTDPSGHGFTEHSFAVKEVLGMCGIDTSDAAQYLAAVDPLAGTFNARLPGTWAYIAGTTNIRVDSLYAPDWDETKLQYMARIATLWACWSLYETTAGVVNYHPELFSSFLGLRGGYRYFVSAVLYQSRHDAVAAGVSPKQKFVPLAEAEVWEPQANTIRVTGTDSKSQTIPHVLDQDVRALTDIAYENYTGEELVKGVDSKLCISEKDMQRLARVVLQLLMHRSVIWKVQVDMAYWKIAPGPVEVARVVTLDGFGDFRVLHMEHETVSTITDVHYTRLVLQSLPKVTLTGDLITFGAVAGAWPGIAN